SEEIFPVCSPRMARSLRSPADLRRQVLLHDEVRAAHGGWAEWLRAAGAAEVDARRGTIFTDAHLMLQAAADGQGVALARSALAEEAQQVERLLDGARASLTPPRARAPAIHAVDEVPSAHSLVALEGPGFFRELLALLADLHAVRRLEPPLLELLAHCRRMLDPRRQRRLLPHPVTLA